MERSWFAIRPGTWSRRPRCRRTPTHPPRKGEGKLKDSNSYLLPFSPRKGRGRVMSDVSLAKLAATALRIPYPTLHARGSENHVSYGGQGAAGVIIVDYVLAYQEQCFISARREQGTRPTALFCSTVY